MLEVIYLQMLIYRWLGKVLNQMAWQDNDLFWEKKFAWKNEWVREKNKHFCLYELFLITKG